MSLNENRRDEQTTPLLGEILSVVVDECGPLPEGRQARLLGSLRRLLYRPFKDFTRLSADPLNALAWRLSALERAQARPGARGPAGDPPGADAAWCHTGRPRMHCIEPSTNRSDAAAKPAKAVEDAPTLLAAVLDVVDAAYAPRGLTRRITLGRRLAANLSPVFAAVAPIEPEPLDRLASRIADLEAARSRSASFRSGLPDEW